MAFAEFLQLAAALPQCGGGKGDGRLQCRFMLCRIEQGEGFRLAGRRQPLQPQQPLRGTRRSQSREQRFLRRLAAGIEQGLEMLQALDAGLGGAQGLQCLLDENIEIAALAERRSDELRLQSATGLGLLGQADAMSADSPVTAWAIKQTNGKLEAAGPIFDSAPYGWPVKKGSPLAQSLQKALEHLITTGDYRTIAGKWGLESGLIEKPVINGAIN
mgnify:CR=1 FL=1